MSSFVRWHPRRRRLVRYLGLGVAVVLAAGFVPGVPALAAEDLSAPPVQRERSVPGSVIRPRTPEAWNQLPELSGPQPVAWPAIGVSTVDVPATGRARAGALPVSVGRAAAGGAPASARVDLVRGGPSFAGLLLRVARDDGVAGAAKASVSIDYSGFQKAYGGDWAARLRLRAVPQCALSTPASPACRGVELPSRNDVMAGQLTADVDVAASVEVTGVSGAAGVPSGGTLLALTAGASGTTGSFAASGLSPSSTWSGGGSSGDFTWSYPMRMPTALGGPAPAVGLAYSSGAVDGRSMATNNQPSWIGEGHDYWPGFIERRYKACADDGQTNTGDQCWETDNATMSLSGSGGELVKDDATGTWRPRSDDGSRIERFTDTGLGNGDNDGEYWRVTTTDGTQFYFGRNRLPGWSSGKPETKSTWTLPVFGNETGEPCKGSTFDTSWCQQAWRWNLDYVVDTHGNTMSYWYAPETNYYGRNADPNKATQYIRGGTLSRIDYGSRSSSDYTVSPVARVVFAVADRCLPNTTCDFAHPENWTDTPLDQNCTGNPCTDVLSPTFWTQKRLSTVTTQVWNGTTHRDVDRWTLRHTWPDPGDATRAGMWLAGITQTGLVGGSVSLPEVKLGYVQMDNRVVDDSGRPPMKWLRLQVVDYESGGDMRVVYSGKDCVFGSRMPAAADTNTLRCHPVKGTWPGQENRLDWFHKYVVTEITENDYIGAGPQVRTFYEYPGTPAWHFDDADGLVPEEDKTWAQWRGYEKVRVRTGVSPDVPMYRETLFFRGMDGDKLANGGTKSVKVTDSEGTQVTDHERYTGMTRENIVYNGVGGPQVTANITDPWIQQTASANHTWGMIKAFVADTSTTRSRTIKAGGGNQNQRVDKSFNAQGLPTQVYEYGDVVVTGDEKCTTFTYARNDSAWVLTPANRVQTYALPCGQTPTSADQVISDVRTYYDNATDWTTPATKGDVTKVEELSAFPNTYVTTSRTAYDDYGRATTSWDALGEPSTMSYEPATGGPLTAIVTRNQLNHSGRTELEPAWGAPIKSVDPNGQVTEMAYDALGRMTGGWLPGRSKASFPNTPNVQYAYDFRGRTGPTTVTTRSLRGDGTYTTMLELYDGLLRTRQTQIPGPNGGRIISDTVYDTLGSSPKQNGAYWNAAAPANDLFGVSDIDVPGQNRTIHDGAGRAIAEVHYAYGVERWRSSTSYVAANQISVTPPAGGTATSAITDAQGRTLELRQYLGSTPTGSYDATKYTYDLRGRLATVTDPAGNVWRHFYDMRGREIRTVDPDRGESLMEWNEASQLKSTTDSRGKKVSYEYDKLGRLTATHDGLLTGPVLTSYTYDTLVLGLPTSASRFVDGNEYKTAITSYNSNYLPTGTDITIPASEGGLANTYSFGATYNEDGTIATSTMPAAGSLPAETLTYGYDAFGNPTTLSGAATYVSGTSYTDMSELGQLILGTTGKRLWMTNTYEIGTRRLTNIHTKREATGAVQGNVTYTYDAIGNVKQIVDAPSATGVPKDTQCFTYDYLRRLKEAWTPSNHDCAPAPTTGIVGGPAPYWTTFGYDKVGNRKTELRHGVAGGTDVSRTYNYPAAGQPQPHTLQSVVHTDAGGTRTLNYGYDPTGNTTTRPTVAGGVQTLTWDTEGRLSKLAEAGNTTEFVYDAYGDRLIRKDPDGSATLYLGTEEIRLQGSVKTGTRYYTHGGLAVAVRTDDNKLNWLTADRQETAQLTFDSATLAVTRRRQTPFGELRGGNPAWPGSHGFVNGVNDPTGLTHLGAREYDKDTGRFLSVDPIIDTSDPQQMHGYSYGNNSPLTFADPTGLMRDDGGGGGGGSSGNVGIAAAYANYYSHSNNYSNIQWDPPKPSDDEVAEAKKILEKDKLDFALEVGGEILMEVLGLNDIRDCFTKGDIMACVMMVSNFIPWTKIAKIPKIARALKRAYDAYKAFEKKLSWAKDILKRATRKADEAADTVADTAAGAVDDVAGAGAKQVDDAAEAGASKADDVGDAGGGSCPVPGQSFVTGTPVLMADGSVKPIEAIQVGDAVLATDPQTGKTDAKPVAVGIHSQGDKRLVQITVDSGDGTATIIATHGHPFWVASKQSWADAAALRAGDLLLAPDGSRVRVLAVVAYGARAEVHNLTVADTHTFYVVAGGTPVLVHNTGAGGCGTSGNINPGNNPAAAQGTSIHNSTEWREHLDSLGYRRNTMPVSNGKIPDAMGGTPGVDEFPVELKPDTRSGIRRGQRDLRRQMNGMGVQYGELWVYKIAANGDITFRLAAIPKSPFRWLKW